MKKFKKLIPALCMLLISAVMLGSSTFAWFSMNNKVTANGMQVQAASNTQFLVISQDSSNMGTETTLGLNKTTGYGIGGNTNNVYPVAYTATGTNLTVEGQTGTTAIPAKGWYTAYSTVYNAATGADGKVTNVKQLYENPTTGQTGLNEYALRYDLYIGLAAGSSDATGTVKIDATFSKTGGTVDAAITALVIVGEERFIFNSNTTTGTTTSSITLKTTQNQAVTVYLFVDGTSTNVNSSYAIANLQGQLQLEFTMNGIAD